MHNLLIDIGNSEIKIAKGNFIRGQDVKLLKKFSYSKTDLEKEFRKELEEAISKGKFSKAGISVLNKKNNYALRAIIREQTGKLPLFISYKSKLPIKINYSKGLGNDRICSAVAAATEHSNKNVLVVDFGTATTFNLIINKTLTGGMISAGVGTSLNSLLERTDPPDTKLSFPKKLITNNSIDNIRSGIMYSALFAVERIIRELSHIHKKLYVIFTGGYSDIFFGKTKLADQHDKLLVLKGINYILNYESAD